MKEKITKESKKIFIRRQWSDWRVAEVELDKLQNLHWDTVSGGVYASIPQPFVHGYIWCDEIKDEDFPHSCVHGQGPHQIKVCIIKKDNSSDVFNEILKIVGPKPK